MAAIDVQKMNLFNLGFDCFEHTVADLDTESADLIW